MENLIKNINTNEFKKSREEFFPISSKLYVPILIDSQNKVLLRDKSGVYVKKFLPFPQILAMLSGKKLMRNWIVDALD
ncbi:hypothetical protein [Bacillus sp. NPDC094106]|uniref:hypothetical protein n=1 Tax=Bacillus sp. NPDC094106 TaxID=3363949 RepID=UPI00380655EC